MSVPRNRPRLAVIGVSGYGRIHLDLMRACRDRGEADIVAAAVINPDEEASTVASLEAGGCAVYPDHGTMLREHAGRIDLCLIPTGIHLHAQMTIAALQAGANVLVEKPLAASLADALAIQKEERTSGRFVAVGFQNCYDPSTWWLADALKRGELGEVRSVRFLGIWPRARSYFLRNDWAGRLKVAGAPVLDSPLNNAFAHFVILSQIFAGVENGDPALVSDEVELFRAHNIESFDTAVVNMRTKRGVHLWFGATHVSHTALEPEIVIEGDGGSAVWRYESEASYRNATGVHRHPVLDQHASRHQMMETVLRRLHDPSTPVCTAAMAARHTALIDGLHRVSPIRSFSSDRIHWVSLNGDSGAVPAIPGLDAALRQAFANQTSLRACGFPAAAAVV